MRECHQYHPRLDSQATGIGRQEADANMFPLGHIQFHKPVLTQVAVNLEVQKIIASRQDRVPPPNLADVVGHALAVSYAQHAMAHDIHETAVTEASAQKVRIEGVESIYEYASRRIQIPETSALKKHITMKTAYREINQVVRRTARAIKKSDKLLLPQDQAHQ
jgi:hypothetical protein